jgi:hypothetical protein
VRGQLNSPAALLQAKESLVPIGWEFGWASEAVLTSWRGEKCCPYRDLVCCSKRVIFRHFAMKVFACSLYNDTESNSDCTAANDWMIVNNYFFNLLIYRRCQYRNCACAASMKGLLRNLELLMERKLTKETEDPSATLPTTNSTWLVLESNSGPPLWEDGD